MNAEQLKSLGRKGIQKVAKLYNVRANGTTAWIIEQLLQKHPGGVPRDDGAPQEAPKSIIKAEKVQLALSIARMGEGSAGEGSTAGQVPAGQPIIEQRVTRSRGKKNTMNEQDVAAGPSATNHAATETTSVTKTKFVSVPTLQGEERSPETALSAEEQPGARGSEFIGASTSTEALADVHVRNETLAAPGAEIIEAGIARRSHSPTAEGSDDIESMLADIAKQHAAKGKGKGKAGPPSPPPSSPSAPLPEVEEDIEAAKEAELQMLFTEARMRNALLQNRKKQGKKPTNLRGRPAAPILTVDTSPAAGIQEPAPVKSRLVSPHTLYNDDRYPWRRRVEEGSLSREPMNADGYDEEWLAAAYVTDMAALGSQTMFKTALNMFHKRRNVPPPEPRQILITGGAPPVDAGSPVDTEVDSNEERPRESSSVGAHGDLNTATPVGDDVETEDEDEDEAAAPVAPPAAPVHAPVDNARRLRREDTVNFEHLRKSFGSLKKPTMSPPQGRNTDGEGNASDDERERTPADQDAATPEAVPAAPANHPIANARRLRREATTVFSPKRRTPSSPSSSGGSTEPAMSPPRHPSSSLHGLHTMSRASRSQNLAVLFEKKSGEEAEDANKEAGEKDREEIPPDDDNVGWPNRDWNPSDFSMPSDDSSSPPSSPGPSKDHVRQILREVTAMTNEMDRLRRRVKDVKRLLKIAKRTTAEHKKKLVEYRRQRKILTKYWLPLLAKDTRFSAGTRKWRPHKKGDKPVNWSSKREYSPGVSDRDLVESKCEEYEGANDNENAPNSPVAGPSNSSNAPGVGHLSFAPVEDWEQYVQIARDDGTLSPKRGAPKRDLDDKRKRARYSA